MWWVRKERLLREKLASVYTQQLERVYLYPLTKAILGTNHQFANNSPGSLAPARHGSASSNVPKRPDHDPVPLTLSSKQKPESKTAFEEQNPTE